MAKADRGTRKNPRRRTQRAGSRQPFSAMTKEIYRKEKNDMTILRKALVGATFAGFVFAAPAFAFTGETCTAAYTPADLPEGMSMETLAARCGCVAEKAAGNDTLLAKLDGIIAAPGADRQAMIDADPDVKPVADACAAEHP
jgi:hypothetical protein